MSDNLTRTAREVPKVDKDLHQRTWSDEVFKDKPRPGFKPLDPEQKRMWEMLAGLKPVEEDDPFA